MRHSSKRIPDVSDDALRGTRVFPLEGNGSRMSHLGPGWGGCDDPMYTLNGVEKHAIAVIGVDVYNQEITGEIAASITAASGGTNTSGPKVIERCER